MQFSQEIINHIVSYLALSSFEEFRNYYSVNCSWYLAARKEYYKNLHITDRVNIERLLVCLENFDIKYFVVNVFVANRSRVRLLSIAESTNSYRLFVNCTNIRYVELRNINPFYILRSITAVSLPRIQQIQVNWGTCNHSDTVKRIFYLANFIHKNSINTLNMPPNVNNENIIFNLDGIRYNFNDIEFARQFNITFFHRYGDIRTINL